MIYFITAADTEALTLVRAREELPVRAVHIRDLSDRERLESFAAEVAQRGRVLVVRVLGGRSYFSDGFDVLSRTGVPLLALPGDRQLDPELTALCTVPHSVISTALEYLIQGGVDNYRQMLRFLSDRFLLTALGYEPAHPTPEYGVYEPQGLTVLPQSAPTVGILFYRAHWLSGNLEPVDALARELHRLGLRARPVFCESLKQVDENGVPRAIKDHLMDVDVLISTLAFSAPHIVDCPVIQGILSSAPAKEWLESDQGLGPRDVAMHVALPEFDGRIISVPVAFKARDEELGVLRSAPIPDRVRQVAELAKNWCALRKLPNAEKRIAILFNNYPTRNARIGNGVGLDTPASVMQILRALRDAGYSVENIPADGDALMREILAGGTHDEEFVTPEKLESTPCQYASERYAKCFEHVPPARRGQIEKQWGSAPGSYMTTSRGFAIPGVRYGNVFVGIQPSRGFGKDTRAIYHSPDLPPTHFYLAYYRWLRDEFAAHAVLHVGKHGNLEWLPGKGIGLSETCYPEIALGQLPNIYPYIINNPGEGTQAKRRSHAVIVDHLIPAMTRAESYGDLVKLEHLADEYAQVTALDPSKRPLVIPKILHLVEQSRIYRDLGYERPPAAEELDSFLLTFDGYLCEIKESQIRDGLHILGRLPEGDRLVDLLVALVRQDQSGVRGLPAAIAEDLGLDYGALVRDPAKPVDVPGCRNAADVIELLELRAREVIKSNKPLGSRSAETLEFLNRVVRPRLEQTPDEIANIVRALQGRFVPPGPSGAPTRGMATILPTGRNFYSVDIRALPTQTAYEVGRKAADALLERYLRETGTYPKSVGMVVWGTSNMRTSGDDIAEIFHLLGVRPVWQGINRRVTGIEVIPLAQLNRPRIDVTVRISGFFRDAFPNVVGLLDEAFQTVAALDEPSEMNFVRANAGTHRIFGSKPGSYGAGLLTLIDERNWSTDQDLADVYVTWGGYAYGKGADGIPAFDEFRRRLAQISVAAQNQDNREHDIFDSDDYFQFHGGMIAAIRALTGSNPKAYFGDTSKPDRVKVRDLREECARVVRSRVVNPKWIASIMKHGYRGASELAATVDYLFGYDATAHVIEPWMYEEVTRAYVLDEKVRRFLQETNPYALRGMVERLLEAKDRGLWEAPPEDMIEQLRQIYLENESGLEGSS